MAVISISTNIDQVGAPTHGTRSVAVDVATLVADGASPTQAHVTTLNNDLGAAAATLIYDTSKITSLNLLRIALDHLWTQARGRGELK